MAMAINPTEIKLRDLFDGYKNDEENGVVGYHGRLDIRPKYQREFIYKDKQSCCYRDDKTRISAKYYVLGYLT